MGFRCFRLGGCRHCNDLYFSRRITSAVYNEVLQFFLIVLGLSPLVIVALNDAGGWANIKAQLPPQFTHAWKYMGHANTNPMGLHFTTLIFGLGFAMSFGYCVQIF